MKCKSDHKTSQISKLIESGEASAKINQTLKHITEIWGKLCPHLLSSDPRAKGNLCHWPNGRSNQSCISKHPLPASLSSALQKAQKYTSRCFCAIAKHHKFSKPMMKSMLSSFSWFNGKFAQVSGRGEPSFDCADRRIWMLQVFFRANQSQT